MSLLVIGGSGAIGTELVNSLLNVGFHKVYTADKFGTPDFVVDALDENSLSQLFDLLFNEGLEITTVANLVGTIENRPFYSIFSKPKLHDTETWNKVMENNLLTSFLITKAYLEACQRQKIKMNMIHFSSVSAQGNPGQLAYSVAKAGVETLTKTLSKELGPLGHRINCIAPGYIDVQSTKNNMTDAALKQIINRTPLRRLGDIESIAVMLFDIANSKFINGQVIGVDGGLKI